MDLEQLINRYVADHAYHLSDGYVAQLRFAVASLGRFLGHPPDTEHLTRELLNGYVGWLADTQHAPKTIQGRRVSLLTLARFAAEEGMIARIPIVKRIRTPRRIPEAWTPDEVRRLVEAATELRGRFRRTGIARAPYMQGLILGLYETGLRLADCMSLNRRWIGPDGQVTVVQGKVGREVIRHFTSTTLEVIDLTSPLERELIWPLWGRRECLFWLVRQLVRKAGIRPGTLKWLRRTGITQVRIRHGLDAAREFADHRSSTTTLLYYVDQRQCGAPCRPPHLWG